MNLTKRTKIILGLVAAAALVVLVALFADLSKLEEVKWWIWVIIALFIMLGGALLMSAKQSWSARSISYAALCVAIGFMCSLIRLWRMPQGGSVTLCAMLPMVALALYLNVWQGFAACTAYGLLQLLQGFYPAHWASLLLDYVIAYSVLALGGFVRYLKVNERLKLPLALIIASVARWGVSVLSGVIFYTEYAIELGKLPFIYSAGYNAFVFAEMALCIAVALIPGFTRVFSPLRELDTQRTQRA